MQAEGFSEQRSLKAATDLGNCKLPRTAEAWGARTMAAGGRRGRVQSGRPREEVWTSSQGQWVSS